MRNKINLIEDEIVSIEPCGIEDTIDITVDDTHMFFANDIYTHNSGINAEFVDAQQSGGNIKRIQKAHFFMSVAKTMEQKESALANIRILKARFAQDGQTFTDCVFNNDTMEIRIENAKYKYAKLSKGQKHHDEKDIEKLESDLLNINEKNLIEKANNDDINQMVFADLEKKWNNSKIEKNDTIDEEYLNFLEKKRHEQKIIKDF